MLLTVNLKGKKTIRKFIEKFIQALIQQFEESLLLILVPYEDTNDIDIFIILNNKKDNYDPYNIRTYINLIKFIKKLESQLEKEFGIHLVDFSTYRIEEYYTNTVSQQLQEKITKLHLLIYPSLQHFLMWEHYSIVMSIAAHSKVLYGNPKTLQNIRESLPKKSLNERIQPLFSLLMETYRNIKVHFRPDKQISTILIKEGISKLKYIIRFTLWEFLMEELDTIPSTKFEDIIQLASNMDYLSPFVKVAKKIMELDTKDISLRYLEELYEKIMLEFQSILYAYNHRGREKI